MSIRFPHTGLYAITSDHHRSPEQLALAVRAAILGGAAVIQYRSKTSTNPLAEAQAVLMECQEAEVPLIINDDLELARTIGADGVHLGENDGMPAQARKGLGADAIIGVSCYDSVERAIEAEHNGASYVAFGRFFPSRTKPLAPLAHLRTLADAKRRIGIPIVAIGGVTADNGRQLLDAGADMLAVIDGVFGGDDPEMAARLFRPLFAR